MNSSYIMGDVSFLADPDDVEGKPGPYCMSFGFDLRRLARSIAQCGLFHAPFTVRNQDGKLDVVTGYRRVLALKSLGWESIPCKDLSGSGLSPLSLLLVSLHDNLATRRLNDVEKAMVLERLSQHLSRKSILEVYMPLLDLPSHEATLDLYLDLNGLEEHTLQSFAAGRLTFRSIKSMLQMMADCRSELISWIEKLKLNSNQQMYFIDIILDLVEIEECSISDFLCDNGLRALREDNRMSIPQRAKQVLEYLRHRRFPSLVREEKSFRDRVARLGLPKGVRIQHPPFFESPEYHLQIFFRSGPELTEKIKALSHLNDLAEVVASLEEDS
jgi:hypothetical protein